jgi:hypothetical protein
MLAVVEHEEGVAIAQISDRGFQQRMVRRLVYVERGCDDRRD